MHPLTMSQCFCSHTQRSWHLSPNDGYGHSLSQYFPIKPVRHATIHNRNIEGWFYKDNFKSKNISYISKNVYIRMHIFVLLSYMYPAQHLDLYKNKHKRVRCMQK